MSKAPRIILPQRITADFPLNLIEPGLVAEAGEHPASWNQYGAVCAVLVDGRELGVKPDEYQWVGEPPADWRHAILRGAAKSLAVFAFEHQVKLPAELREEMARRCFAVRDALEMKP